MPAELLNSLLLGSVLAAAAGILGAFAILKRMTLAGDVMSHIALPGIGFALLVGYSSFAGAFAALLTGAFVVWVIRNRTNLPEENVIGIIFAASLAAGVVLTPGEELIDALFGGLTKISMFDAVVVVGLSLIVLITMIVLAKKIVFSTISPDLAKTSGINPAAIELIFLLAFATVIALGVRFTGTLLMGALIIMPAAAAKNISKSLRSFVALSIIFACISTVGGFLMSYYTDILPGPIAIFISSLLFSVTILFRWR